MTTLTLVAIDFSGTLSPGAAAFGRPPVLQAALERSGLTAAGIHTPADYWREIVAPTWTAASVSARSFAGVIAGRLMALTPGLPAAAAAAAAGRFVSRYFEASAIAAPWGPLMRDLCRRDGLRLIVTTDHYAEATGAIIGHLAALGLAGAALGAPRAVPCDVRVANSADLGCHKVDAAFWRRVAAAAGAAVGRVVLIDDFGAAEADDSGFARPAAVVRRRRRTEAALRQAGGWAVHVHPFAPAGTASAGIEAAVAAAAACIRKIRDGR